MLLRSKEHLMRLASSANKWYNKVAGSDSLPLLKEFIASHHFISRAGSHNVSRVKKFDAQQKVHRNRFKEILENEVLYGRSVCNIALKASRRSVFRLHLLKLWETTQPDDARVVDTVNLASKRGIPITYSSRRHLDVMSSNRPHQGVCLEVGELSFLNLDEQSCQSMVKICLENDDGKPPLWVLLCGILDPMNLGAILRSCLYFNVDKVVVTGNCAPMTPVVSKASSGAAEILKVYSTDIPSSIIQVLTPEGWDVFGTVSDCEEPDAKNVTVEDIANTSIDRPSLLLIGSEGFGIPIELLNLCTRLVTIRPNRHDNNKYASSLTQLVGSLNVSTATAVILHRLQQHGPRLLH